MRAVVTVVGLDRVGILAEVTKQLACANANILEVSQTILDKYFTMILVADTSKLAISLDQLRVNLQECMVDMQVHVVHEDVFNSMHRI